MRLKNATKRATLDQDKKKSKFKQKTNYEFINLLSKDWVMS